MENPEISNQMSCREVLSKIPKILSASKGIKIQLEYDNPLPPVFNEQ